MKNNKEKILMIVGIITLLVFVGGATFAYFVAQGGSSEQTNINVTTHTTDSLVFEVGKAISITADQTTFAPGAGNRSDNTFARTTLKANSSTNQATDHYYVYLSIDTNEFKYTTESKTAELILTVNYKDNEGNVTPVTSINGLNYVTVGEVSGFDITEEKNLITIANNYEITSTGTEVDEWDITLTLVNLDSNQTANAGKVFNSTLLIQKEMVASQYIASLFTTQGANHLYHHNGTIIATEANSDSGVKIGDILDAEDKSYRYAGGNYSLTDKASVYNSIFPVDENDSNSLIKKRADFNSFYEAYGCTTEEQCIEYSCGSNSITDCGYDTFENLVIGWGFTYMGLAYTNAYFQTESDALNQALEDKYLVKDLNNYVCFESDENKCIEDNLYRIIGVFDERLKLIKATNAKTNLLGEDGDYGSDSMYYWNKKNYNLAYNEKRKYNLWSYSELNKTNLNTNFLNNIGNKIGNMIDETTWYVGPHDTIEHYGIFRNVKLTYEYELGTKKDTPPAAEPYLAKIGLMYMSDYFYAAVPTYWTYSGGKYNLAKNDNWMYTGMDGWTITAFDQTGWLYPAYEVQLGGSLGYSGVVSHANNVRPTFYLKPSVTFAGGTGTETDPYRIA